MSTENYGYLTVEQALADLNRFTGFIKTDIVGRPDLRFFGFGGSYPGALAAWYRVLYPEATVGTLSSSGVVNAILDFPEFDEQVGRWHDEEGERRMLSWRRGRRRREGGVGGSE